MRGKYPNPTATTTCCAITSSPLSSERAYSDRNSLQLGDHLVFDVRYELPLHLKSVFGKRLKFNRLVILEPRARQYSGNVWPPGAGIVVAKPSDLRLIPLGRSATSASASRRCDVVHRGRASGPPMRARSVRPQ